MKILITGPQGSGKTTQAEILAAKLGLCLVGAGDLVREFSEKKHPQSAGVRSNLDRGELVDNDVIYQLVKERLAKPDCALGFVSDGYPRSEDQSAYFDPEFDKVIYLDISDQVAEERLLKRGRKDDTLELIDNRLNWYHQETEPLLKKYQPEGKLIKVDGTLPVDEISEKIYQEVTK